MIIDKLGNVAYNLLILQSSMIHHVFHVSQMKKCKEIPKDMTTLPQYTEEWLISSNLESFWFSLDPLGQRTFQGNGFDMDC